MHKDFYCAYHHNQILTNFCCCRNCLLPVCPLCIKLHSQQHLLVETNPQYQSMTKIYNQIQQELQSIQKSIGKQVHQLSNIEKQRKQNNKMIKDKIIEYRDRIIREFHRAIQNFEYETAQAIIIDDENFIMEMQRIDDELISVQRDVRKQLDELESQRSLKTVISFYSQSKSGQFYDRIRQIQEKTSKISDRNIEVAFSQRVLKTLRDFINEYIKVKLKFHEKTPTDI